MIPLAPLGPAQAAAGTSEELRLLDMPQAWVVVLVILPLFVFVSWIAYAREGLSLSWRVALGALRFTALLLLFLVLCRPVLVERREEVHPPEVVVLVDDSASMRRRDAYAGDAESSRAIREVTGLAADRATRAELASAALLWGFEEPLEAKGYAVRAFRFSDVVEPLAEDETLAGRGNATHIGDAVLQSLASHRGRHVTDVVVLSDGRNTGGAQPIEAGQAAASAGVPVHSVVVGDTRPERNAVIELVEVPSDSLEGDEIAVTVRVLGRGTQDSPEAHVVLEELEADGDEARTLADRDVELSENGERVVLVAPARPVGAAQTERRFRVSLPPLSGETMVDDNRIEFSVNVSPEKVRILYVEGYPRWEYRRLALDLLKRADENFEFQCFLLSATADFPQECSSGLEPLRSVPTSRKELLENYDVILLGDVNPWAVSNDEAESREFIDSLRGFVESGGGLLFQAGEFDNPQHFRTTALEDLLPVVLDPTLPLSFQGDTTREFRPTLEEPSQPHEIVRLHPDPEVNRELIEDPNGLPGFHWYAPVQRAKHGAQVLLRHPSDGNQYGRYPLLVTGYYPSGRTLYLGVDSTWRWYKRYGRRYHERFWRNAIRWLALGRLKSGDRRNTLDSLRPRYDLEERITLEARVLDEDFRPSERPAQEVRWRGPGGEEHTLPLLSIGDRPGVYRGSFDVDRPGLYRAWIESEGQRLANAEFEVVLPSRENADPSPDPDSLANLASVSGGRAVDLAGLPTLESEFPGGEERREPISSRLEDAWDRWATLFLALALLSTEWILRKRMELV